MSAQSTAGNRLVHETSPYLLQHAHNPVDWYPWGEEALERAREEEKPILLSIGYSACHWCHVMERESFENEAIAELMNRSFVNIKVDREERPDLDDIYMAATLAMNQGQGGWPMTVFLTPELEPIFAGTYFPPDDRWGRPGFASLLERIARAFRDDREDLTKNARAFAQRLRREKEKAAPPMAVGEEELRLVLSQYSEDFDERYGGFGRAPKFPPAEGLKLLLRLSRRFDDENALVMVKKTLDGMARGGLFDHVGGGFARYSTDEMWLVPHFEKMLYDNALLISAYLEGYQATGEELYRRIATETLDYILREMISEEGGIYSATDADSEGEEGKFFVWSIEEINEFLEEDEARAFCAFYDITPEGNWEGRSIPNTPRPLAEVSEELGSEPDALRKTLDQARRNVFQARKKRVPPDLDDKVLTAWNAMMIAALAQAFDVLGERRYLEAAERAADFVKRSLLREDGGLFRTYRAGKAHLDAYLEDYAWMSEALVTLYEAGGESRHLREAAGFAERILRDFADRENGGFWNTAHDHEKLILRYRDGADGAVPSPNAVAASALARLAFHLGRDDFRAASTAALRAHGQLMKRYPRAFAKSLSTVEMLLDGPVELALVGRSGSADLEALRREIARHFIPHRIQAIAVADRGEDEAPPLVRGKALVEGKAALYICRDFACQAPITDPKAIAGALSSPVRGSSSHRSADREEAHRGTPARSLANPLAGRATAEGTERYARRHGAAPAVTPRAFTELGKTGLCVSRLGFGAYRVGDSDEEGRESLLRALRGGINLIDTSTNYTDGASERMIGTVLAELAGDGGPARDEIVVVSKIGYVQGRNYEMARQREAQGCAFPEMVKVEDGLWHSIHPDFLEDQLRRSLDRLELETLDVCLLHNPEYFLADQARRGEPLEKSRDLFYRRLEQAFRFLEIQVAEGRIGAYGVSSNTVGASVVVADMTSLERMLEAARSAGSAEHHFRVLQMPLNLYETGPVFEFNTANPALAPLELARRENLAVLTNRPLNALSPMGFIRLADVASGDEPDEPIDFKEGIARLSRLEAEYRENVAAHLSAADGPGKASKDPADAFRWSQELSSLLPRLSSLEQWSQMASQIAYVVNHTAATLDRHLDGPIKEAWDDFKERYFPELDRLLAEMRRQLREKTRQRNVVITAAIDPVLPEERRGASLAEKALHTVKSTPGVSVVLNGMRRPKYVEDALEVLAWPDLESPDRVYQAIRNA